MGLIKKIDCRTAQDENISAQDENISLEDLLLEINNFGISDIILDEMIEFIKQMPKESQGLGESTDYYSKMDRWVNYCEGTTKEYIKESLKIISQIEKYRNCIDIKDNRGVTPLHKAVSSTNIIITKLLIKLGADVNVIVHNGDTPLHLAAKFDLEGEITKILIEAGADINAKNNNGDTPIDVTIVTESNNWKNVRLLIKSNAVFDNSKMIYSKSSYTWSKALDLIINKFAEQDDSEIVDLLMKQYKTNICEKDLMYQAIVSISYKSIKLFLKKGISLNYFDKSNTLFIDISYPNYITNEQYNELLHLNSVPSMIHLFSISRSFSSLPSELINKILTYSGSPARSEKQIDNVKTKFMQKLEESRDQHNAEQGI